MHNGRQVDPSWWRKGNFEGHSIDDVLTRRDVARIFRLLHTRGWSWAAIARATELTDARVREIARGDRKVTSYDVLERICDGLLIPRGRFGLAFTPDPDEANRTVTGVRTAPTTTRFETADEILARIGGASLPADDDAVIKSIEIGIADIVDRYEQCGPEGLANATVRLRRRVDTMFDRRQRPRRLEKLYLLAGRLSGLLGYMAVNSGRLGLGELYCTEAYELADAAADNDLRAWIRGTQSFAAYYSGRYRQALDFAQDGLRHAGRGPQAIRLLINGEARARARLDPEAAGSVDSAVARAFDMAEAIDTPTALTSCISFGAYGRARIAANAATAYLSLGRAQLVLDYAAQAQPLIPQSGSVWSQTLIGLDVSGAFLAQRSPEVEQAAMVATRSLEASRRRPVESVRQRAAATAARISTWRGTPAADAFLDWYADWAKAAARTRGQPE